MALNENLKRQFADDGFFILPKFFGAEEIGAVRGVIDEWMDRVEREAGEKGGNTSSQWSSGNRMLVIDFFAEKESRLLGFCGHPRLVEVLTGLLGPDIRLYYNQAIYKPPESAREFPWHQDNGYAPVEPEEYVTCWVALNDATVENGCIWVQPGTHRQGTLPHADSPSGKVGYAGPETGVAVPVEAGSVVVFSSLLLHRSGPNVSGEARKAYVLQYVPSGARNGRTGKGFEDRMVVAEGGRATAKCGVPTERDE